MSRRDGEDITVRFEVLFADINAFSSMVWLVFCELECSLTVYYPVSLPRYKVCSLLSCCRLSPVACRKSQFLIKKKEKEASSLWSLFGDTFADDVIRIPGDVNNFNFYDYFISRKRRKNGKWKMTFFFLDSILLLLLLLQQQASEQAAGSCLLSSFSHVAWARFEVVNNTQ